MSQLTLSPPPSAEMARPVAVQFFSDQSKKLESELSLLWERLRTLWQRNFFQQIGEVYRECSVEGWDGYGAKAISMEAVKSIITIVMQLPLWIQTPEIVPTPVGRLGLEWYAPEGSTFVLEPSGEGKLNYVALLSSGEKISGTSAAGMTIPEIAMQILAHHFKN